MDFAELQQLAIEGVVSLFLMEGRKPSPKTARDHLLGYLNLPPDVFPENLDQMVEEVLAEFEVQAEQCVAAAATPEPVLEPEPTVRRVSGSLLQPRRLDARVLQQLYFEIRHRQEEQCVAAAATPEPVLEPEPTRRMGSGSTRRHRRLGSAVVQQIHNEIRRRSEVA